ncbi:Pre-mRNA-splicing factor CWC22-like protein [Hypsibius exemplaris]|uniref:Pre-mRNA-splicing factor CWC22-like protein n=1 Tax=Hypsibius exemplaris TaxID=2072580 RepID=A0A1W0WRL7_HYPEX|nr:Pre-mRNA-splicing factor CWC22-like protein [Hypsibius exemplaris]
MAAVDHGNGESFRGTVGEDDETERRSHRSDERRREKREERPRGKETKSSRRGKDNEDDGDGVAAIEEPAAKRMRPAEENQLLTTKTGGAYIPPARLRMMQAAITDKSSIAYQRIAWEALKKSIHGLINKVNVANIHEVALQLFKENIVRGRGWFAKSCIQAQTQSPTFTHVFAALVAIINTKFPQIGELVLKRLITNFRKAYKRNQKATCLSSTRFIAHLVNQQVADEVIALEIVTLLMETPTDDSVEVAIGFLKECGLKLLEVSPKGLAAVCDQLRTILHEAQIDTRVQYMAEVMFAIRKDGFKDYPSVMKELDLVEEGDQFTHPLSLTDEYNPEDKLDVFQFEADFEANEDKYRTIRRDILDEEADGSDGEGGESGSDEDDEDDDTPVETVPTGDVTIVDQTETNLVTLRKNIYLTIQSSLDYEECCHKLMKLNIKPGQESELCHMIVDCCAQQRTYEKFFGLLAQRFCQINQQYVEPYQKIFVDSYDTIHRLETNKLRNVGKFMAHLFFTDAISWLVLGHIKLNEEDTTSSSRIFIKIMFQEIAEYLGMVSLIQRIRDPALQEAFEGLFPRDNPKNTRFSINFFTSIGLGGLTDDLREHLLKAAAKKEASPPMMRRHRSSRSAVLTDENGHRQHDDEASPTVGAALIVRSSRHRHRGDGMIPIPDGAGTAETGRRHCGDGSAETVPEIAETVPEIAETLPESAEKVPEIAEKVPEIAETVPEIAEKVPEIAEKVPEIAEIVEKVPEIGSLHLGDESVEMRIPIPDGARTAEDEHHHHGDRTILDAAIIERGPRKNLTF